MENGHINIDGHGDMKKWGTLSNLKDHEGEPRATAFNCHKGCRHGNWSLGSEERFEIEDAGQPKWADAHKRNQDQFANLEIALLFHFLSVKGQRFDGHHDGRQLGNGNFAMAVKHCKC